MGFQIGTKGFRIVQKENSTFLANDYEYRRSISSYIFTIHDNCISWKSRLQFDVSLSTIEFEYIKLTKSIKEALWIQGLLKEIELLGSKATMYTNSQ